MKDYLRAVITRWLIVAIMVVALILGGPAIIEALTGDDSCDRVGDYCLLEYSDFD